MSKLHRVLVGVDYSEPARAAFDHALALSRSHDAELLVVHAVPGDRRFSWHARERLELIAGLRRAADAAGVRFKVSVMQGDPAGVIVLHANARRADVIVLGTSERTGFDRLRLGSVAETVAIEATQPVLVVPPAAAPSGPLLHFDSIVVAVDLAEGSKAAVERALAIASEKTRVTVVHVVQGAPLAGAARYMYHLMEPEYQRQLARDAWRRLAEIVPPVATAGRKVHTRVVTGDPATEIVRVASEVNADLTLVGVKPRGAFGRLLFGSTATRVIRGAGRPVLAIPQLPAAAVAAGGGDRYAVAA